MHDALVTGPQLDRPNILRVLQIDGEDKIPKDIAAARRQPVGLGHLHHQVRGTHLPSFGKLWLSWQIRGLAFGPALLHPLGDKTYLNVGEAALTDEISITRLRRPWGHVAALNDCDNLRSMLACVF